MKKLWLHSVRTYLRLGMFFYFKRIHVQNVENLPKNKPVLLLSNHQNALLDPLLIATQCGRFSYFLTRAAVFKKAIVSRILKSLQMLPVYRVRDGWKNIANNNAIFDTCSSLLNNNMAVVIFPEGSHNLARRVRPLSKGFTRIVFDTLEKYPEMDLQLVPIGVNYVNATSCPDSTAIIFGKPISARTFLDKPRKESVIELKQTIFNELTKLTTHIPESNYENDLHQLEALNVDFLKPNEVNNCLKNDFKGFQNGSKGKPALQRFFRILLILNLLIPYVIWKLYAQPKIKELEFTSTFRFAVALTLVPIYLLFIGLILSVLLTFKVAVIYVLSILLLSLLTVKL